MQQKFAEMNFCATLKEVDLVDHVLKKQLLLLLLLKEVEVGVLGGGRH